MEAVAAPAGVPSAIGDETSPATPETDGWLDGCVLTTGTGRVVGSVAGAVLAEGCVSDDCVVGDGCVAAGDVSAVGWVEG
ncbi:hypothetical protein [Humisphaera borealis]|uniref:Uncharacterized protein n=1 Tax=Humisphaera borealis TaxID=2807512 RepID=A0A7M2WRS4_9BACT|nr:hypothetical protein [Humisphaera borealis]QOV88089.1 hypothetical protein IPV69_17720 [Humisphaera borealis]